MPIGNKDLGLVADLSRYERRLETPIVPGEHAGWIESACQSFMSVERGPDKASLHDEIDRPASNALLFTIDVREQDASFATWYLDSFDRDQRTVD